MVIATFLHTLAQFTIYIYIYTVYVPGLNVQTLDMRYGVLMFIEIEHPDKNYFDGNSVLDNFKLFLFNIK